MNVIWIVADTFRQDHVGVYGKMPGIHTPSLDALAGRGVRFDRHYAGGFPTMPTRADHATGRWTASFMTWEPLPDGVTTLAEILAAEGIHTAAMVDTPFYLREGMNYDRGFQTFNSPGGTRSELYNLKADPKQENNVITQHPDRAESIHEHLVAFMQETRLAPHMLEYRKRLLI